MSAGRFFVAPEVLADPDRVALPAAVAFQARAVLRLRAGNILTLLDGSGAAYTLELSEVEREQVRGRVIARDQVATEPRYQITLYQGLLKAAKFEWIVQKGTEIGVGAFVPVRCTRSIAGAEEVSATKLARWRAIATEAAEQSDRGHVPAVREPVAFAAALAALPAAAVALLAAPPPVPIPIEDGEGEIRRGADRNVHRQCAMNRAHTVMSADGRSSIAAALAEARDGAIHLFVGPEGGFAPKEVARAQAQGVRLVTLGPRILRAETAALVAATLALAALGEME
jgi:16S rRNA (uracil1498-N3)-methyltransferase